MEWINKPEIINDSDLNKENPESTTFCGPILAGVVACTFGPLCGRLCVINAN